MSAQPQPDREAIRKALGALVTRGLAPFSVVSPECEVLLELALVQDRLPDGIDPADDEAYEEAAAKALTEVLSPLVKAVKSRNYRVVLDHVLPLMPALVGEDVTARRTAAGVALVRGRNKAIKPSSVRTYYEREALDQLAEDLVKANHQHLGEPASRRAHSRLDA